MSAVLPRAGADAARCLDGSGAVQGVTRRLLARARPALIQPLIRSFISRRLQRWMGRLMRPLL
jgi:hypothetical protein